MVWCTVAVVCVVFRVAARLSCILLLVLLAKGWTISTQEIEGKARIGQVFFLSLTYPNG